MSRAVLGVVIVGHQRGAVGKRQDMGRPQIADGAVIPQHQLLRFIQPLEFGVQKTGRYAPGSKRYP